MLEKGLHLSRRFTGGLRGLFLAGLVFLAACTSLLPPPTPTLSPLEDQGRRVFGTFCQRCHGITGDTVIVGPSLAGISSRAGERMPGLDAQAYIKLSILDPDAFIVPGFEPGLMPLDISAAMTEEQVNALTAYLLTLK